MSGFGWKADVQAVKILAKMDRRLCCSRADLRNKDRPNLQAQDTAARGAWLRSGAIHQQGVQLDLRICRPRDPDQSRPALCMGDASTTHSLTARYWLR